MNDKTIFALLITMLSSPFVLAKDDADYLKIADAFSECSALQTTLAGIINHKDKQHSQALKKAADDANTIAGDFLEVGGYQQKRAQSQFEAHFIHFQSMLSASKENVTNFTDAVKPVVAKCAALHGLQTTLIAARKKQNYQSK